MARINDLFKETTALVPKIIEGLEVIIGLDVVGAFDFVDDVKSKNIDQNNKDNILELMAINLFKVEEKFEITLLFKNNAFITLLTEVLEVTLEDQNKLND